MIEILEVKDAEKRKAILLTNGIAEADAIVLQMTDRDTVMGNCFLMLDNGKSVILKLLAGAYDFSEKPDMEQSFILGSLVRSAASYAETKGVLHMETAFPDFHGFFARLGFQTDQDHAYGSVGVIIKYHA